MHVRAKNLVVVKPLTVISSGKNGRKLPLCTVNRMFSRHCIFSKGTYHVSTFFLTFKEPIMQPQIVPQPMSKRSENKGELSIEPIGRL
jgi:hypothetical protein